MESAIHAICLRVVRHSDSMSIATVWSREFGRLSLSVPAGPGRAARRARALLMPLSEFECVVTRRPGNSLGRVSDLRQPSPTPGADPLRGVVAMFLADFLYTTLRDSQADTRLSDFVFGAARMLHTLPVRAMANFHLYFIYNVGECLGIAPDSGTYRRGYCLDMREGIYSMLPPPHRHVAEPAGAKAAWLLSRVTPAQLTRLRLPRDFRNRVLDAMLDYFGLHHTPLTGLPSLRILREVLA